MYRRIVKQKVIKTFKGLSDGQWDHLVSQLADDFEYRFVGSNALGGTRTSKTDMVTWTNRVTELLPDARFDVRDVVVAGPPWNTTVFTYATVSSGEYQNEQFQSCLLYTSPSPRDRQKSRMPSSA